MARPRSGHLALALLSLLVAACGAGNQPRLRIVPLAEPAVTATTAVRPAAPTTLPATVSAPSPLGAGGRSRPPAASPAAIAPTDDPALRAAVLRALGPDADGTAVVVRRLTDGRGTQVNGERIYYAASLYKLAVLYEAFRRRESGDFPFSSVLPVTAKYIDEDLGTFARVPRTPDGGVLLADAVEAMVTLSDNTSATLLLDALGHGTIDRTLAALGLQDTSVNSVELPATARDMARLMEVIVRGEGLGPAAAREMTALLLAQETRAGIPRGLPPGVAAGNKTGTWPGATHDVAVVFAPSGAYVLAVLSAGSWAWDPITRVSAAVYEELERRPAGVRR